ncbi:MAG: class I SAM-dependent methyltransferase [Candidatus Omnitrophica bacterium]|nr:class I SAM-dependent methyltransferase [Candidatus Omnitrophota bacterium]
MEQQVIELFEQLRKDLRIDPCPMDTDRLLSVAKELEDYYGKPFSEVAAGPIQQLCTEDEEIHKTLEVSPTESQVTGYYSTTSRYVFGNLYLEGASFRTQARHFLIQASRKFRVKRALDFGGGSGDLCVALRKAGLECDYLDVPGPTLDFAKWRFQSKGLDVRTYTNEETLPAGHYDAVYATDVFEHLWDLGGAIAKIAAAIKEGGVLISYSTFTHEGAHLEKNLQYADVPIFNRMLAGHGLRFLGQLKESRWSRLGSRLGLWNQPKSLRLSFREKHGGNYLVHRKTTN